jgi:hypothetical protein
MKATVCVALALGAGLLAGAVPARAQSSPESPGQAPYSHMYTLLQRTLLKIDVLTVDVCFDAETARRFARLAGRGRLTRPAADSIVAVALASEHAQARVGFLRDVSLDDFLEGVRDDLWQAVEAGLLADSVFRVLQAGLPSWYSPLRRRGIRKGDQILYDMGQDEVRTVFLRREGTTALEHRERGRGLRNSPLATWLARGSSFRPGMLESLRRDGARAGSGTLAGRCRAGGE